MAKRLGQLSYADVALLEGGIGVWHAAGVEPFSGVNVSSRALGASIERHYGTESIDAGERQRCCEPRRQVSTL